MGRLTPRRALLLSVLAALATMGMKAAAWWLTGSVGFLSDALESIVNLAAALFALAMVSYAGSPPDSDHPYGHGKAEYFSSAFEGMLIFVASLAILVSAGERFLHPRPIGALDVGAALSVGASLVNLLVARVLFKVGREHRSLALEADARHLMTDVWTTAGVIVGVGIAGFSGWLWLDPVVAAGVALNILREGWHLMRRSVDGLMDRALSEEEIDRINEILSELSSEGCTFSKLRTRLAGTARFADVHLRVPADWSVKRAHDLADAVEQAVEERTGARLTTHVEPLDSEG